jgi:probable HAF family extracellular repeat protein
MAMILIPRRSGLVSCLISFFSFFAAPGAAQPVPIDLGTTIPNIRENLAVAVNDTGHVVGRVFVSAYGPPHALVWTPSRGALDLAPGRESQAYDVNNLGQVVGYVGGIRGECNSLSACRGSGPNDPHAVIWSAREGLVELGTLGGTSSAAFKVNDAGQVFGVSEISVGSRTLHAFVWTPEDGMVDLGPWPNMCVILESCGSATHCLRT